MSIFQSLDDNTDTADATFELPEFKDVKWDEGKERAVYKNGEPVIVSGIEAVYSWIYRAIKTARMRFAGQSSEYGCEIESLIGLPYAEGLKQSEAVRYIQDALLINPYIKSVRITDISFEDSKTYISGEINTEYGKVALNATV